MWYIKALKFCASLLWPAHPEPAKSRKIAGYRLIFAGFSMLFIFCIIGMQSVALAIKTLPPSESLPTTIHDKTRGSIFDQKGRILASTVPINILYADPKHIFNPEQVASELLPFLPKLSKETLLEKLTKNSRF